MEIAGLAAFVLAWAGVAVAGQAHVESARMERVSDGTYTVIVTVRHADEGWNHYADAWQVLAPDGTALGTRELVHPHVDEQPFTRSLRDVRVPEGVDEVRIRARDKVHGYGGREVTVTVPR
ncbi:hypothetical protein H0Z60_14910 [Ectothiorhodospiraceae bacterium WFHF3C12]|nr:hypothetical protein [Ectothiorhodospiraceae bacterium WFHF3C12]